MKLISYWKYSLYFLQESWLVFLTTVFLVAVFASANSQSITIQSIAVGEGKVMLNFSLEDSDPSRRYTLRLYSSIDNYVQPLEKVSGNIGVDQRVGGGKQIIWDARAEQDSSFNDYVAFEIRAFIYIPFIEMGNLSDFETFKRGKSYTLSWSGGRGDNVLNFELLKAGKKTGIVFNGIANIGTYEMTLPKNTKPGRDYSFRIADQHNNDEVVFTNPFKVKAQIPLIAKVAGGAVLAAAGIIIYNIIEKNNSDPQEIPNPADPSRGN